MARMMQTAGRSYDDRSFRGIRVFLHKPAKEDNTNVAVSKNDANKGRLIFKKRLSKTDAKRKYILLPKASVAKMPHLEKPEGITLRVRDFGKGRHWDFTYKFWPRPKTGRTSYLLASTGHFAQAHRLQAGDIFKLYRNQRSGEFGVDVVSNGRRDNRTNHKLPIAYHCSKCKEVGHNKRACKN